VKTPELGKSRKSQNQAIFAVLAAALSCLLMSSCGGGGGGGTSTPPPSNPVPNITGLSPSSVTAGTPAQALTINGTNFMSSSTVTYNSVAHTATYVSSTQLTIPLSASDQATVGTYAVVVTNPSPGGGASNSVNFAVDNPVPVISSLSPLSATMGAAAQSLTINGTNYLPDSTVTYNGVAHIATYVSAEELTIPLSASDQATAGEYPVVVTNPTPGGGASNSVNFTVGNPAPTVSSISPAVLAVGSPPTTITVDGNNFMSTSQILLNGESTTTTFVSSSQLNALVPASLLASGTSITVSVANAAPGGGTSSALSLQLLSVSALVLLATPADVTVPDGPWMASVTAQDASGNALAGLPISIAASQGTLDASSGTTDANGSFSTAVTAPSGISATTAVGLTATVGGQSVSATFAFTGIPTSADRSRDSAALLRFKLSAKATPQTSTTFTLTPAAIGISTAAPGSTTPFANPSSCYTFATLTTAPSAECLTLFQNETFSFAANNPFQAACGVADIASNVVGVSECVGAAVTVISCVASATGIGSVASLGATDAICAATLDITASALGPDCATFISGAIINHYSPKAATTEEMVQLTVEPSANPLDYLVTLCDLSNPATNPTVSAYVQPVAGNGNQGFTNGAASRVELNTPTGIAMDKNGDVYFDDAGNNVVRELVIADNNLVLNVIGTGSPGYTGDNGPASQATLNHPTQLAFDADHNLYIADADNNAVRMVSATTGEITTVVGTGAAGYNGDNIQATKATLSFPDSLAFDSQGDLYIADAGNNRIREVSNGVITTVAGNGVGGFNRDGILATDAWLNFPSRVVLDLAGNMYIADYHNNRVRLVTRSTGMITTLAGNGTAAYQGNNGPAASAELNGPISVALDSNGNVYIADAGNQVIRAINMGSSAITLLGVSIPAGDIATIVGGGSQQTDIVAGPTLQTALGFPTGLLLDLTGNLYFADATNNVIVKAGSGN
jgi:hypothetical protein